ncbi:MAG: hypothetical protein JNM93_11000 [Bacteriovoracaceae bacterium]|nr:hypothetical protein [Bacteriovoracaceae bacterium]
MRFVDRLQIKMMITFVMLYLAVGCAQHDYQKKVLESENTKENQDRLKKKIFQTREYDKKLQNSNRNANGLTKW